MSKSTLDKLTNTIAKWIVVDFRSVVKVEDWGLMEAFQIASSDSTFKPPLRATVMKRFHQLYDTETKAKEDVLARAEHAALTGDHWTSMSNHNF